MKNKAKTKAKKITKLNLAQNFKSNLTSNLKSLTLPNLSNLKDKAQDLKESATTLKGRILKALGQRKKQTLNAFASIKKEYLHLSVAAFGILAAGLLAIPGARMLNATPESSSFSFPETRQAPSVVETATIEVPRVSRAAMMTPITPHVRKIQKASVSLKPVIKSAAKKVAKPVVMKQIKSTTKNIKKVTNQIQGKKSKKIAKN